MEKNSYTIDKNVLILRTNCGEYNFKMDSSASADMIHRIAQLMVSEMAKAETSLNKSGPAVNPYIIGLLANLNLSKKYVELETRLETLGRTLKEKTKTLANITQPPHSPATQPDPTSPQKESDTSAGPFNAVDSEIIKDLHRINKLLSTTNGAADPRPTSVGNPVEKMGEESLQKQPAVDDAGEPPKCTANETRPPSHSQQSVLEGAGSVPCESADSQDALPCPDGGPVSEIPDEVSGDTGKEELAPGSETQTPQNADAQKNLYTTAGGTSGSLKPDTDDLEVDAIETGTLEAEDPEVDMLEIDELEIDEFEVDTLEVDETEINAPQVDEHGKDFNSNTPGDSQIKISSDAEREVTAPSPSVGNQHPDVVTDSREIEPGTKPAEVSFDLKKPGAHHNETGESANEKETTAPDNTLPPAGFPIHTVMNPRPVDKAFPASKKDYPTDTFQLPTLEFLKNINSKTEVDHESIRRDAELLEKKLGYFGIKGEVMGVSPGPVITTFEYKPDPGIKISKIVNLADDLALALSAYSIRIVAPIPGKDVMGIEIPNLKKSIVPFIDIVSSADFINTTSKLPICLGKDIIGNPVVVELESMPHLLIAGATGTGKSVGLNAMITSILYKANPDEVKFLMIDPKRIELSLYNDIPHLITPVITDMKKATTALQWMVREMERRYDLLAKFQVRNIEQYNNKIKPFENDEATDDSAPESLSYIVIIIDELADLMMTASRDVELSLTRLAQMARAAGIHLILATQRPSVDVLTGIIKANFPTRISFQVSSKTDSRTIIDANGAETLLGMGDMLFVPPGTARLTRVHGTYLSEEELVDITSFLKAQQTPEYLLDVITEPREEPDQEYPDDEYDEKYNEALEVVMATRQASISGIQRALRVGYNRAARIIDLMEKKGIVGPSDGSKPRQVLSGPMN